MTVAAADCQLELPKTRKTYDASAVMELRSQIAGDRSTTQLQKKSVDQQT